MQHSDSLNCQQEKREIDFIPGEADISSEEFEEIVHLFKLLKTVRDRVRESEGRLERE